MEEIMHSTKSLLSVCLSLGITFLLAASVHAVPTDGFTYSFEDNYYGAKPTHDFPDQDVIGDVDHFGIDGMTVSFDSGLMNVDIHSNYFNNIGELYTALGDLFISTDGWNPNDEGNDYRYDNAANGEKWEYALVMDDHRPSVTDGDIKLYSVSDGTIVESSSPFIYREGQEVQLDVLSGAEALETGTWSIIDDRSTLRFSIGYENEWLSHVDNFGFHWTMTCGNDVIEGMVPTPEPASMILLGTGLLGAFGIRRKVRRS